MNAYWCHLEGRTAGMSYERPDPGEFYVPCGIFIAETRGQAKRMLVDSDDCVEAEEFLDVRTALLDRDVELADGELPPGGELPDEIGPVYFRLWKRVHEVEDHAGKECDCMAET